MRCYIANRLCTIVCRLVQVQAIVKGCSMRIELHAFDTPNGRKISVALEEMALPYIVTIVDIRKGHQFATEFLKISPNGKIPAIIDPEGPNGKPVSVFESGAILIYLGEKTGTFWPRDVEAEIRTRSTLPATHRFGPRNRLDPPNGRWIGNRFFGKSRTHTFRPNLEPLMSCLAS
jgi:glutathione S-transferase